MANSSTAPPPCGASPRDTTRNPILLQKLSTVKYDDPKCLSKSKTNALTVSVHTSQRERDELAEKPQIAATVVATAFMFIGFLLPPAIYYFLYPKYYLAKSIFLAYIPFAMLNSVFVHLSNIYR